MVRLDPGELFIGSTPAEVHTVLGSCVSVVIHHARLRLGAICHARKPDRECYHDKHGLKVCQDLGDYVSCSLHFMLAWFDQRGVPRQELDVKLFGGSMMFNNIPQTDVTPSLNMGKRNVDTAMTIIRSQRLHLTASDVGGPWARQIIFQTDTGEIRLKRIRQSMQELLTLEYGRC
ncbi:MAG: chemotaxis protein CheD [Magnetococcales bacterium]|nr:chemotaxis protein CheD [Magnetococcales bacterium]